MGTKTTDIEILANEIDEIKKKIDNKKDLHDIELLKFDGEGNSILRSVYTDGSFGSEILVKRGERGYTGFVPNEELPVDSVPYGTIVEYSGGELPSGWMFTSGSYISSKKYPQMKGVLEMEFNYNMEPDLFLNTLNVENTNMWEQLTNQNRTSNTQVRALRRTFFKKESESVNNKNLLDGSSFSILFYNLFLKVESYFWFNRTYGNFFKYNFQSPSHYLTNITSSTETLNGKTVGFNKNEIIYINKYGKNNTNEDIYIKGSGKWVKMDDLMLGFISMNSNNAKGRSDFPEKEVTLGAVFSDIPYQDNIDWTLCIDYLDIDTDEWVLAFKIKNKTDFVFKGDIAFNKVLAQLPSYCNGYRIYFDKSSQINRRVHINNGENPQDIIYIGNLGLYFFDKNRFNFSYKLPEITSEKTGLYKIIYVGQPVNIIEPIINEINQVNMSTFFTWPNTEVGPYNTKANVEKTLVEGVNIPEHQLDITFTNRIKSTQYPYRNTTWTIKMPENFDWAMSIDYHVSLKYNFKIYNSNTKNEIQNLSTKFFNELNMGQSFDVDLPTLTYPFEVRLKSIVVMLTPK